MINTFGRLALVCFLLLGIYDQSHALTPQNRAILEKEFASRGSVVYDLFAPLGSSETGYALIETGQPQWELLVLRLGERGSVETVLSEPFPKAKSNAHPFTLLYNGTHLLTFEAVEKTDINGAVRLHGDMVVRDITDKGDMKELFKLRDVVDIGFTSDGMKSETNLLWQPATHFLNQAGFPPHKYNYFRLTYKPGSREYKLYHHLEPIPNATTDEYANFNNRAIIFYYRGRIVEASRLLSQAWNLSGFSPVVVQHNQDFVKGELANLASQAELETGLPFDDALLYYWQGEFSQCLQVLMAKEKQVGMLGLSDRDLVLTGLVLAHLRRWVEADGISIEIHNDNSDLQDDYLSEMAVIAGYEGLHEIEETYLKALEVINPDHPGYIAGIARLLRRQGESAEAQSVLETYLRRPHENSVNLLSPSRELLSLYLGTGDTMGIEWLTTLAGNAPIDNLLGYANMVDYWDLSNSLVDVVPEKKEGIKLSEGFLEQFGVTQ